MQSHILSLVVIVGGYCWWLLLLFGGCYCWLLLLVVTVGGYCYGGCYRWLLLYWWLLGHAAMKSYAPHLRWSGGF